MMKNQSQERKLLKTVHGNTRAAVFSRLLVFCLIQTHSKREREREREREKAQNNDKTGERNNGIQSIRRTLQFEYIDIIKYN